MHDYTLRRIIKIEVNNFLSYYGQHEFLFDSTARIIKIAGKVGAGKTNLLSSIIFALFGSISAKESTKIELMNDTTSSKLPKKIPTAKELFWVKIHYANTNDDIFILKRTAFKTSTKIELFDSSGSNILESYKNVASAQEFINAQVLSKFDFTLFNYVATFFIDSDKTVLNLLFDKQLIFELLNYFVDTKIYDEFVDNVTKNVKQLRDNTLQLAGQYNMLLSKALALKEKINNHSAEHAEQIKSQVSELEAQLQQQNNIMSAIQNKMQEQQQLKTELTNLIRQNSNIATKLQTEIQDLEHRKAKYNELIQLGKCPTCHSNIQKTQFNNLFSEIDTSIQQKSNELQKIQQTLTDLNAKLNSIDAVINDLYNKSNKVQQVINNIMIEINKLKQAHSTTVDVLTNELNTLLQEGKQVSTNLINEYSNYKTLKYMQDKLLTNNRLKQYLYLNVIDTLNKRIKYYAKLYDFALYPQFITTYERKHWYIDIIVYNAATGLTRKKTKLSTGEKRLTTLLIFISIFIEAVNKFGVLPLMLFDEFISNLDVVTRDKVIAIIESVISEYNLQCFFVTHAEVNVTLPSQVINL